ncbi:MarR family winged helix-turn-helix transcriptional regulator [Undibacterium terreum]|uniref:MarR family transcriptional regulator n=1 Tax=Undibacterium terreum TaxID=1224302 RepID=A0A916UV94_9BURK|nr:MarR family transcriptional regulator [Undibacterium terreum]GGC90202.1 MarR family transcriptional regulator [Undibacterium terreum]
MKYYTKENFDPANSVGFALYRARNLVLGEMDTVLKDLDITGQQMGVILSMSSNIASNPFELSKLLDIDTGLMTRMLDKLEKLGILARVRSVEDRRMVNLELTDKGHHVAAEIRMRAPEVLNKRLEGFSTEEFLEFRRLLAKFLGA